MTYTHLAIELFFIAALTLAIAAIIATFRNA
jgi:hypothetical protein